MNVQDYINDWNWQQAFDTVGPNIHSLSEVYYAADGENDGADWLMIGRLDDGRYFVLSAWCDYTGWDCQSGGYCEFHDSLECAKVDITPQQAERLGLPHDGL